jgi:hypothetical protein
MPPPRSLGKPREAVLLRAIQAVSLFLFLAACAGEPAVFVPGLPADVLPGMESEDSVIGLNALARDALEPGELRRLLDDSGFMSGREQTFSGPGERFSLAVTRVLAFASPDGATAYLGWLRGHAQDLLGPAETLDPLDLPGEPFLLVHTPGGCCPKAVPIYLSAWRRGSMVLFVRASGREADPGAVRELAAALNSVVEEISDA